MKTKYFTATLCICILSFTSCEDFLAPYNPAGVTEEMLYSSEAGFESGVNACYDYFRKLNGKKQTEYLAEFGTDLWTQGDNTSGTSDNLLNYTALSGSEAWVGDLWNNCYKAINQCNAMLNYLRYAKENVRTNREAELKVLRSYFWWILTENFGDIHFTTQANSGKETTGIRTTPEKVYEQIFKDLTFAISEENLPSTTTDLGRITRPAAEAFLARMYLTRGKNAEAITHAQNVINNYGFELEPVENLWDGSKQRSNKEAVWTVYRHSNNILNGGMEFLSAMFAPRYTILSVSGLKFGFRQNDNLNETDGLVQLGLIMPTYHLLNLYDQTSDARFSNTFKHVWRANENRSGIIGNNAYPKWSATEAAAYGDPTLSGKARFALGDTSLVIVFNNPTAKRFPQVPYNVLDETDLYDNATKAPKERRIYFQLKKYFEPKSTSSTISSRDYFIIRLSEMYLIIAEADFKINGTNAADGLKALNDLRAKRALPDADAAFTHITSIPDIDFILDERARELCGEQLRWFDLKRTGKLVEYVRNYNPDAAGNIKDFHANRPYPDNEIQKLANPEDFIQEGYQ